MSTGNATNQEREWGELYERIRFVLQQFGEENPHGHGDYWVLDDNWGIHQHKVEIHKLQMLQPVIIKTLQNVLIEYPDWDIMIGMDIPGKGELWPAMGLIIRDNEIIDGLKRQYLPREFQGLVYEGSRPGTDRD